MEISEVRVFLKDSPDKKLKAYATVTFDNAFVVRNIKVIQGTNGLFIAMPSRKVKHPCPRCNFKNEFRSRFCNQCGAALPVPAATAIAPDGHDNSAQAEHKDIAHPITQQFREALQKRVLQGYELEVQKGPHAARADANDDL
ncbi:MAG TPA: SpoVG family protein [Candidatus Omnitrophota bacterium]|nr:SpoVG family protein [Candidatus Omnitrophota bacterium]HQJ15449.1 SpoVG family protein [Candidatus Omnitrophota bacterium]